MQTVWGCGERPSPSLGSDGAQGPEVGEASRAVQTAADAMGRSASQRRGDWAEQRALRLLQAAGWTLLEQRWSCRWGELDLLLHKPQRLLLVEVKGRACRGRDGWGVAALKGAKRRRLETTLNLWLQLHPAYQDCRWEWICALVPLPPSRVPERWMPWL